MGSALKGGGYAFRELRPKRGYSPLRVVYAFDPRRDAVLIIGGDKGGDSNGEIFRRWRSTRYHHPDDDLSQPFDWDAAAQWTRFEFLVAYSVVQGARPKWKKRSRKRR